MTTPATVEAPAARPPSIDDDSASCVHCGLPVSKVRSTNPATAKFCCVGCETVHRLLTDLELTHFYDLKRVSGTPLVNPSTPRPDRPFASFDDPEVLKKSSTAQSDGTRDIELSVENVSCAACVWLLERLPRIEPGVRWTRVDLSRQTVNLRWDPAKVALSSIAKRLDDLGYPPHLRNDPAGTRAERARDRRALARIAVAGAGTGNVMLFAFALYAGKDGGLSAEQVNLFRGLSAAVAIPTVLYAGSEFFGGAYRALKAGVASVDVPLALGLLVSLVSGAYNTLRQTGDIYFDSVTMLVFVLLCGRLLHRSQLRRARQASEWLVNLLPAQSRVIREDDSFDERPTNTIERGMLLYVKSSERIPVDGVVEAGQSSLDTSWLTGESRPTAVAPGATVIAGAINLEAALRVRATAVGPETRVARVLEETRKARASSAPIERLADKTAGYFVTAVVALAALTFAGWAKSDVALAFDHTIALLIVTCPCALALTTPLATAVGLAAAARRGLLIKGSEYLEALSRRGLFVFDKTGTLTSGCLAVVEWWGDERPRPKVTALAAASAHPVAQALCRDASSGSHLVVEGLSETQGRGMEAIVEGERLCVGSVAFLEEKGIAPSTEVHDVVRGFEARMLSSVLVAVDGSVRAVVALGDRLRDDARESLRWLTDHGHRLAVLSGDRQAIVDGLVRELGLSFADARGNVTPEQKVDYVRDRQRSGQVFMVGDGVNDGAALAAATVGIAISGGTEASLQAASVYSTSAGLSPLVSLVRGARHTLGIIRTSMAFSLAYNVVVASLAVAGLLHPLGAAVLMPLSSFVVVTLGLGARHFGVEA